MSDVRQELAHDGQAYIRANRARERAREKLGDTIRRAAAEGLGPAEVTRLAKHAVAEKTVARIMHGSTKS